MEIGPGVPPTVVGVDAGGRRLGNGAPEPPFGCGALEVVVGPGAIVVAGSVTGSGERGTGSVVGGTGTVGGTIGSETVKVIGE